MARAKTNVINFASRAASVRKQRSSEATKRRQKELIFKARDEGTKVARTNSTTDELVQDVLEWCLIADSLSRTVKTWQKLYMRTDRQLKDANNKIAKLERQLAAIKNCSA